MNNEILDIIISLVKGVKNEGHIICGGSELFGSNYLLNQVIRQYKQPDDHYFVSEKAKALWDKITSERIMDKFYQQKVILDRIDGTTTLKRYKGNSNSYKEWTPKKNDSMIYNNVFHDEHIVPIKMIIAELKNLQVLNYENVKKVLDKIYICKMLKEEDKSIVNKSNRPLNYREAIFENYTPKGIVCINVVTGEKI